MKKIPKIKALGTYEIARRCHVTPSTVFRWIKSGKLKAFQTAGGRNRVLEADLEALIRSLEIPGQKTSVRVLIVDDELVVRRFMKRLIQSNFPKAEIHEATDGYEAGFKTRDLRPDLVILDLMLPCINGIKVCRMIRKDPNVKAAKILAVTAYKIEKSRRVILRAGANEFLAKPFSSADFVKKIADLMRVTG